MYQVQPDSLIEVQMVGRLHNQTIRNVFHFLLDEDDPIADGAAEAVDVATTFKTDIWPQIKALVSEEYRLVSITAQWTNPTRFRMVEVTVGENGSLGQNSLPSTVAVVVSFYAEFAGRAYQGRKYFAGLASENEQDSRLDPAQIADWNTMALDIANGLTTNVSGNSYKMTLETPASYTGSGMQAVQDVVVRDILRVQRRREVGVGE